MDLVSCQAGEQTDASAASHQSVAHSARRRSYARSSLSLFGDKFGARARAQRLANIKVAPLAGHTANR